MSSGERLSDETFVEALLAVEQAQPGKCALVTEAVRVYRREEA